MTSFFANHWSDILLSIVTAAALGSFKYLISWIKKYHGMLDEQGEERLHEVINVQIQPLVDEIEALKKEVKANKEFDEKRITLILASYRFQIVEMCKKIIEQGYITAGQHATLVEIFHCYEELGGNGQAKEFYNKALTLPLRKYPKNK